MSETTTAAHRILPDDVAGSERFRTGLARLAQETGRTLESVTDEARKYLEELRTGHSDAIYRRWIESGRRLLGVGYSQIDYDPHQVERLRELLARHPAVVLSSHRSYLDGGAINVGFFDRGLPNLISFPGINMAFWPLNHVWRRCNAVFIRRGGASPVYRYVLREFLGYLVEQRRHMTWFIEGTRSRTGKLGPPRLGLLGNVVDGYREGRTEDLLLVPVSVSYDQLREAEEYAGEGRGAAKKAESLGWLVRFIRAQRGRYGTVYVRFGEPVSVREALGPPLTGLAARDEVSKIALQKLAFEVSWRINHASPITGTSLVTLTLLAARGVAMTATQIRKAVQGYLVYARRRGLPMAPTAALDTQQAVVDTLTALEGSGVLSRYAEGPEAVYSVGEHEHLAASYYRNSIIHFFLLPAIAELALLQAAEVAVPDRSAAFWEHAFELRDLLKFEFFFQEKDEFREALAAELAILAPDWAGYLARGPEGVRALLNRVETLSSDMMLRSFIEAYLVVADALAGRVDGAAVDEQAFLAECMALGRQYLLQRRIRNPESVSRHLFQTGVQLARNRGLWDAAEGVTARRRGFAARLRELARHMRTVNKVAVHRLEQETGSDAG